MPLIPSVNDPVMKQSARAALSWPSCRPFEKENTRAQQFFLLGLQIVIYKKSVLHLRKMGIQIVDCSLLLLGSSLKASVEFCRERHTWLYIDSAYVENPKQPLVFPNVFFKIELWLVRHPTATGCVSTSWTEMRIFFYAKFELS